MNTWLLFLLKSTLILSLLYLVFRLLIRKETLFLQSRIVLIFIVIISAIIPIIYLPSSVPSFAPESLNPIIHNPSFEEPVQSENIALPSEPTVAVSAYSQSVFISTELIVLLIYSTGVFISFCLFIYRLTSVLRLIGKSRRKELNGVRLIIINDDIPAFTFGKFIVMSKHDFEINSKAILTHEMSHIKQGHFYDLMLMELVKIIYWFNPLVYYMNSDMKEIHEFQADEFTIKSGIDAVNYQLLIIQKGVGHQKFALANSFNHCQIKNRITMMNKSKNSMLWSWKVATFLPLLVLLLMAFSRKNDNPPKIENLPKDNLLENIVSTSEIAQNQYEQFKQKIEIKGDGNYINNKLRSLDEIEVQGKEWRESSNDWIFLLIDESIPFDRIDEVREALNGSYWVIQTTVNSDDLVYFAGDVNQLAKFSQGKWGDWMENQLNNYPEIQSKINEFTLLYSFIIDKHGKVRDGHVTKGCEYPEINEAFEKILTQFPDWEPAMRFNESVSVYFRNGMLSRQSKKN